MSSNQTNLSEYCSVAQDVLGARGFAYLLMLEIVVGLSASIANVPLMVVVWRVSVFHYNLRLLLSQLSFGLLWYSVGYVVKALSLLDHIVRNADPCDLTMDAYACRIQEFPYTISVSMTMFTLLGINLERLYSTLLYRRYEKDASVPWLGCLLAAAAWICAISVVLTGGANIPKGRLVGICENLLSLNAVAATKTTLFSASLLVVGLICCIAGYLWNTHRLRQASINRAQHTLATRFQIDQNVKVNRVMMPSMFIVTLCYLPNYAFLSIVIAGQHLSYEIQTWLIHVNYLWKLVYALAHAVLSFKRNTYLHQRMSKVRPVWTNQTTKRRRNEVISEHQIHFNILEEAWRMSTDDAKGCKRGSKQSIPTRPYRTKSRGGRDQTMCSTMTKF